MTRSVFNHRRGTGSSILLSQDGFNRADSTVTLGSTEPVGVHPSQAWVQNVTWGITSNQAELLTHTSAPDFATAYVDLNEADVDLQLTVSIRGPSTGILFRYVDSINYLLFLIDNTAPGICQMFTRVAGEFNGQTPVSGTANGDVLRVVARGTRVEAYKNGVLIAPAYTMTDHATATKHGIHAVNMSSKFDNWSARTP